MEENKLSISVEQLRQLLTRARSSKASFKIPLAEKNVAIMLRIAWEVEVSARGGCYRASEAENEVIREISAWASGATNKTGLLLCGNCGNGKTTAVYALQNLLNRLDLPIPRSNDYWGLRIGEARQIAFSYLRDEKLYNGYLTCPLLAIDDLGQEPAEIMHYGSIVTPIVDLLVARYRDNLGTIITTNLLPSDIRSKYGGRVADRMNEQYYKVIFSNDSYRG